MEQNDNSRQKRPQLARLEGGIESGRIVAYRIYLSKKMRAPSGSKAVSFKSLHAIKAILPPLDRRDAELTSEGAVKMRVLREAAFA